MFITSNQKRVTKTCNREFVTRNSQPVTVLRELFLAIIPIPPYNGRKKYNNSTPTLSPCRPAGPSKGEGKGGGITQSLSSMNFFRLIDKKNKVNNPKGSESLEKILGHFTELIKENNETLEWITDLEEKQGGQFLFDRRYLRSTADRITDRVGSIVDHLIRIAPNRYEELKEIYTRIRNQVEKPLRVKKEDWPPRKARSSEKIIPGKSHEQFSLNHPILLEGGTVGAFGIGTGPVYVVRADEVPTDFPKGAVLVAPRTSSRFVSFMDKASAIVTDRGSATGHMALMAREFRVPTLVDTREATEVLKTGQLVTVDSFNARIYAGRVEPILKDLAKENPLFLNTPVYERLKEILGYIVPLNLADPKLENFNPGSCLTFHDIIRFAHEKSIEEMFRLSEREDLKKISPIRIKTPLPLNLHLLDLGGGLKRAGSHRVLPPENVISLPFKALWKGITSPGIHWAGPIGLDVKGLLSVMAQSAAQSSNEFWDRTLALVSLNYLNFSSRLGYHFATVDSFCGPVRHNNYIAFVFKGGAADSQRRGRRARFLGIVLEELGFEVMIKEDLVRGDYRKYPELMTEEKLDHLGRLMGCARQLDMTLADENLVVWYAQAFLSGNYEFKRED